MAAAFPLRKLLGFVTLPLVAALTPLMVIPALTANFGGAGWAALAVGQALGAFAVLLINYAWGTTGSPAVSRADEAERVRLYQLSVQTRLVVLCVVFPVVGVIALASVPSEYKVSTMLMAFGTGIWGMNSMWFFVGTGTPSKIAVWELFPKLGVALVSIILIHLHPRLEIYPVLSLVAGLVFTTAATMTITSGTPWKRDVREVFGYLRENFGITLSRLFSAGFVSLAIVVVNFAAPGATPIFATTDRVKGFALQGLFAVSMAFQGWAFEAGEVEQRRRVKVASAITVGAGVMAGIASFLLLYVFNDILFSGVLHPSLAVSVLTGVTVLVLSASMTATYHHLAPSGRTRPVVVSAVTGALVGVPLLWILTRTDGVIGAVLALLATELLVLVVCVWGIVKKPAPRGSHVRTAAR